MKPIFMCGALRVRAEMRNALRIRAEGRGTRLPLRKSALSTAAPCA
jgi:hypothetical protein